MRKIVSGLMVTANGIYTGEERWSNDYQSQEFGAAIGQLMMSGDAILMGRKTYETLSEAFADQSGGQADMMNNTPKYVVSDSLKSADWEGTTIIKGKELKEELGKLKKAQGANINVTGSGTLVRSLMEQGLLDELNLFVFPLAVGEGSSLWAGLDKEISLADAEATSLPHGVVHMVYRPE